MTLCQSDRRNVMWSGPTRPHRWDCHHHNHDDPRQDQHSSLRKPFLTTETTDHQDRHCPEPNCRGKQPLRTCGCRRDDGAARRQRRRRPNPPIRTTETTLERIFDSCTFCGRPTIRCHRCGICHVVRTFHPAPPAHRRPSTRLTVLSPPQGARPRRNLTGSCGITTLRR